MNARLLVRLLKTPPKPLPPPDPLCRKIESDGALILLFRNHEDSKEISKQLHQPRKSQ